MHDDEVATDSDLVRRLIAAQFPKWAELPISPVSSSGTCNALYRLGEDKVVRLPRAGWADGIAFDFRWLPMLSPLLPCAIPEPLGRGRPTAEYPFQWGVYGWLEGENPVAGRIADGDGLALDLARVVRALRVVQLDGARSPDTGRGGPLAKRDEPTRKAIDELHGLIDTDAVTRAWEAALRAPVWSRPRVWIHSDLMPGNLLLQGGKLSAVIDWDGSGLGDPACDLIVAWNLLPASARGVYRDALGVDSATWDRGRGLALSIALIALPYYKDTNPEFAENARHAIREVLADARASGTASISA